MGSDLRKGQKKKNSAVVQCVCAVVLTKFYLGSCRLPFATVLYLLYQYVQNKVAMVPAKLEYSVIYSAIGKQVLHTKKCSLKPGTVPQ